MEWDGMGWRGEVGRCLWGEFRMEWNEMEWMGWNGMGCGGEVGVCGGEFKEEF